MAEKVKIDLKDRKILRELDMNARMPIGKLAKKVGLSRQVVEYRIRRMQEKGIISGVLTIFDSAVIGMRWFRVAIQLHRITRKEKQDFIEYFKKHPNTVWLGEVGGNWDFVLNFVSEDQFSFDRLFESILARWGGLIRNYEVLVYINVRDQERGYVLEDHETDINQLFHEMKFNPSVELSDLDKKIIPVISKNAFATYTQIAAQLGVSYKTIQKRMRYLEDSNVILGYRVMLHPGKLGYESYMLFLGIRTYDAKLEKKLYQFLKHPNVTFVVKQLGRWRIGLETEVKSREEFQELLIDLRTAFGDIIFEYETFPIFYDHLIDYFPKGVLK
jgi:DNA-binding Lrp family transcriptional regulator